MNLALALPILIFALSVNVAVYSEANTALFAATIWQTYADSGVDTSCITLSCLLIYVLALVLRRGIGSYIAVLCLSLGFLLTINLNVNSIICLFSGYGCLVQDVGTVFLPMTFVLTAITGFLSLTILNRIDLRRLGTTGSYMKTPSLHILSLSAVIAIMSPFSLPNFMNFLGFKIIYGLAVGFIIEPVLPLSRERKLDRSLTAVLVERRGVLVLLGVAVLLACVVYFRDGVFLLRPTNLVCDPISYALAIFWLSERISTREKIIASAIAVSGILYMFDFFIPSGVMIFEHTGSFSILAVFLLTRRNYGIGIFYAVLLIIIHTLVGAEDSSRIAFDCGILIGLGGGYAARRGHTYNRRNAVYATSIERVRRHVLAMYAIFPTVVILFFYNNFKKFSISDSHSIMLGQIALISAITTFYYVIAHYLPLGLINAFIEKNGIPLSAMAPFSENLAKAYNYAQTEYGDDLYVIPDGATSRLTVSNVAYKLYGATNPVLPSSSFKAYAKNGTQINAIISRELAKKKYNFVAYWRLIYLFILVPPFNFLYLYSRRLTLYQCLIEMYSLHGAENTAKALVADAIEVETERLPHLPAKLTIKTGIWAVVTELFSATPHLYNQLIFIWTLNHMIARNEVKLISTRRGYAIRRIGRNERSFGPIETSSSSAGDV
jgi:hypothetical protein